MTDLAELAIAVAALYVAECFMWLRRGGVTFHARGRFGRARSAEGEGQGGGEAAGAGNGAGEAASTRSLPPPHRIAHPSATFGNHRGGLVFLDPLPPLGTAFTAYGWPLALDRDAAYGAAPQTLCGLPAAPADLKPRLVRFADMRSVTRAGGGEIRVNGELFVDVADATLAHHLAALLDALRGQRPEQREATIGRAIAAATDVAAIRERLKALDEASGGLRAWCHALFALMLVVLPVVALGLPHLYVFWLEWLLGVLLCLGGVVYCFAAAHRRLLPRSGGERWHAVGEMILLPLAAIRATSTLSRHVLAVHDPLAVAAVVCDRATFATFARRVLLDLRHPVRAGSAGGAGALDAACAVDRAFRERLDQALTALVAEAGHDPVALTAPPARQDPALVTFCPRCDAQYVVAGGACADCGGIPLVALPTA